jgi:hypothetical protein
MKKEKKEKEKEKRAHRLIERGSFLQWNIHRFSMR